MEKSAFSFVWKYLNLCETDRILVFEKGKIVEDGIHEELINKNGVYAKLYSMQVSGFMVVG